MALFLIPGINEVRLILLPKLWNVSSLRLNHNFSLVAGPLAPIVTINDVPPTVLAQIAALATAGKLGDYLAEHGYNFGPSLAALGIDVGGRGDDAGVALATGGTSTSSSRAHAPSSTNLGAQASSASSSHQAEMNDVFDSLSMNPGPGAGVATAGNSNDPYNTTVFVGGLSALISEDTLRSFFSPFGEIHYVRVSSDFVALHSS